MIRGIHHISLKCADADTFERAKGFFLDVLGLTLAREWPEGAMIDTDCGLIELFCNGECVRAKGAIRHVALLTDDVDGMAARSRRPATASSSSRTTSRWRRAPSTARG